MDKLMPIGELFKKSFQLYKSRALLMGALMLIPLLACVVGGILLLSFGIIIFFSNFNTILVLIGILAFLIVLLAWLIINVLSYISLFYCLKETVQPTTENIKNLLLKAWRILVPYVWLGFLVSLILLLGFILLIIPGIIFSVWFFFSSFFLIFEGVKGSGALKKSKELTKEYWWPIFGRFVALMLVAVALSAIPVVGNVINLLCVTPFAIIYSYLIWQDLKTKKTLSL